MSEQSTEQNTKPIPPLPDTVTDDDQLEGGQERWENCPLRDCKKNPELLYEDFYLRDIRNNRLMCSACAVRVEMGYMAREEVKKADDRFFQGTQLDNAITFGIMFAGSIIINALMLLIGFWILGLFIGGSVGAGLASFARRRTSGRYTRQMPYFAMGGIVLGALLAPTLYFLFSIGQFFFSLDVLFNIGFMLPILVTSGAMASTAYGIFMRRI